MLSDQYFVAVLQDLARDRPAVDEGAVGAAHILEDHLVTFQIHARMMTRHGRVIDDHRVVRETPDCHTRSEGVFLQDDPFILER